MFLVARARGPSAPISESWCRMARDAMDRKNWSAREVARRINKSHTSVTRTLSGQESSRVAFLMAGVLDIPPPVVPVESQAVRAAVEDLKTLKTVDADAFADIAAEIHRKLSQVKRR